MKASTILILLSLNISVFANSSDTLFLKANAAYKAKDFDQAVQLYEGLTAKGMESPELEYNLANAYYRQQKLGKAILHYERAKLLAPDDEDIIYNLEFAEKQLEKIEPLPEFFLTEWWKNTRMALSSSLWGILSLVLFWGGVASLWFWLFGKTRRTKKIGFFVGISAIIIGALPFSLALNRVAYEENTHQAIIISANVKLKSAPDESGSDVFNLQEGEKVQMLESLSGWWQVELPNGERGWLAKEDLEEI